MYRQKSFRKYFKSRVLRIFPLLAVICAVLAFIAGPILTELTIIEYFKNIKTYRYMLNSILILQHNLPGVFTHNIYGQTVNGSLWTLPIEFLCYIMCFILYKLRLLEERKIWLTTIFFLAGCIVIKILSQRMPILASTINPIGFFYAGMLYFIYKDKIKMDWKWNFFALLGMIISIAAGILQYTIFLFLPYFLVYIGFATKIKFSNFAKHGEISYGIYLCAFPIQQVLCQLWGGKMSPYINFILTVPIVIIFAVLCCKFIEEPIRERAKGSKIAEEEK